MIDFGHGTHVGLRRDHNEDTYCAEPQLGLWLVADGMGGHEHGEVASAMARDSVIRAVSAGKGLTESQQVWPPLTLEGFDSVGRNVLSGSSWGASGPSVGMAM